VTDDRQELIRATPALAKIAAAAWWRSARWTVDVSVRAGARVVRAAETGETPAQLFQDAGSELRGYVRTLLGEDTSQDGAAASNGRPEDDDASPASLRRRGADLLNRSADVELDDNIHPAFARILDELAPDEGRILRLLATEGAQPSVDVRTGTLAISVNSQLVAGGLTMIGAEAGCRHLDRVHSYLDNLNRLGLIWFSREALDDLKRYQVLEAQPEVIAALKEAGRGRTVRRSINLTPFGEDFCEMCLPLGTAELDALPGGAVPEADPADGEVV
jgi:Abortive infection alpha